MALKILFLTIISINFNFNKKISLFILFFNAANRLNSHKITSNDLGTNKDLTNKRLK